MTYPRLLLLALPLACGPAPAARPPASTTQARFVALPGATGSVTVDFIGYEPGTERVWVPVGETGSVDVFGIAAGAFTRVDGFKTAEREAHGRKRMMGPSSIAFGRSVAYVGDRASSEVCVVDTRALTLRACVTLSSAPDAVAYVPSANELWVTTPKEQSIAVLDVSEPAAPRPKVAIKTEGDPEGVAIDDARGTFYTNLEDKNQTVAIDIKTHTVAASWPLDCPRGPRGVAADHARRFVYVACTDGVRVLDADHGTRLGVLDTGDGVDDIDYVDRTARLYVAAGKSARLTVARIDDHGTPTVASTTMTISGGRNAVVDATGTAYLVDPTGGRLMIVP